MSSPAEQHRRAAPERVRCAVVTVSDSRSLETDTGGALLVERLTAAGHEVLDRRILPDEPEGLRSHLGTLADRGDVEVVITTGGTGITPRDSTYEVVAGLIEKRLSGFGELFRMLSYQEIGAAAMLSRAVGGTYRKMVICSLPGSPAAVRLALEKLLLPELTHLAFLVRPKRGHPSSHKHPHQHGKDN